MKQRHEEYDETGQMIRAWYENVPDESTEIDTTAQQPVTLAPEDLTNLQDQVNQMIPSNTKTVLTNLLEALARQD